MAILECCSSRAWLPLWQWRHENGPSISLVEAFTQSASLCCRCLASLRSISLEYWWWLEGAGVKGAGFLAPGPVQVQTGLPLACQPPPFCSHPWWQQDRCPSCGATSGCDVLRAWFGALPIKSERAGMCKIQVLRHVLKLKFDRILKLVWVQIQVQFGSQ